MFQVGDTDILSDTDMIIGLQSWYGDPSGLNESYLCFYWVETCFLVEIRVLSERDVPGGRYWYIILYWYADPSGLNVSLFCIYFKFWWIEIIVFPCRCYCCSYPLLGSEWGLSCQCWCQPDDQSTCSTKTLHMEVQSAVSYSHMASRLVLHILVGRRVGILNCKGKGRVTSFNSKL